MLFNKVLSRILTYQFNFSHSHQKDKTP
ncbi:hypothetical protein CEQ34_008680 [Staphylococcus aureus]|nr:hypothetical protein QP64_06590 [Staphylococcus aureus]MBZ5402424.1 hypothetical protein [Staphylococcus aureus]MBZ5420600.1 hypothetical protein [Staphylococcus aureus]MCB8114902.1 hypothetical protein [Staphylococcus aureus]PNK84022.1 hypothetical protein CEQ34_008680 [Staphylococcus aureus]